MHKSLLLLLDTCQKWNRKQNSINSTVSVYFTFIKKIFKMMRNAASNSYMPKAKMEYLRKPIASRLPGEERKYPVDVGQNEIDANILHISLASLAEKIDFATGDPTQCKNCGCFLSACSEKSIVKEGSDTVWNCEFCAFKNKIILDPAEMPKNATMTHVLAGKPEEESKEKSMKIEKKDSDISVIFCIDNSGSMGNVRLAPQKMQNIMVKPKQSRIDLVKFAVKKQIEALQKQSPNIKVGLVTFDNIVKLIGDGSQTALDLDMNYYNDFYKMVEYANSFSDKFMAQPIKSSYATLNTATDQINAHGDTALGPALVASVALAAHGSPGSKVIICTDGLANRGMGAVTKIGGDPKEFYSTVGNYAKQHDLVVSVLSLVDSECRLDLLSPIAGITGGDVLRVDPKNLHHDFDDMIKEQIIATQVVVKVNLPKYMKFTGTPEEYLTKNGSTYTQEIGSATKDSEVTCRYTLRGIEELEKITDMDCTKLNEIPFQLQVEFRSLSGQKCLRIHTYYIKCTEDIKDAKKGLDKEIIKTHSIQTVAKFAKNGDYKRAMMEGKIASGISEKPEEQKELDAYMAEMNNELKNQLEKKQVHQSDRLTSMVNQKLKSKK